MYVKMTFNKQRDLQEVEQFGFVDLNKAYDKGVIEGSVSLVDESFNGVVNPATLISRSHDVFDSLRKARYVRETLKKLSAREQENVEKRVEKSIESAGPVTE